MVDNVGNNALGYTTYARTAYWTNKAKERREYKKMTKRAKTQ
jgi:hypothetical protein